MAGGKGPILQSWAGGLGPVLGGFQMETVGGSGHKGEAAQIGETREEAFARDAHSIRSPSWQFTLCGFQDLLFSPNELLGFLLCQRRGPRQALGCRGPSW